MNTIVVLGQRLKPFDRVGPVGAVLGLTRATAYRQSTCWPMTGEGSTRYVIVPALLAQLGIPYVIGSGDEEALEAAPKGRR